MSTGTEIRKWTNKENEPNIRNILTNMSLDIANDLMEIVPTKLLLCKLRITGYRPTECLHVFNREAALL